ncbi:MAG: hypothetical protein A3F42_04370 [Gammaproteobacteria bacterium RIFCSPHIGHO2_12_FULL_37_34]|nr:MAG: hypothetical protein A3F42_04370 [Gammaproteobacteria bacterium RIFCSPHIGHO2_12_FULL_37_34]
MTNINLEELAAHLDVHIKSKNKEEPEDAKLRRFKDKWLFIATIAAICIVFIVCIALMILQPNFAGIALNGIIGLTMALAGYYVRGKS